MERIRVYLNKRQKEELFSEWAEGNIREELQKRELTAEEKQKEISKEKERFLSNVVEYVINLQNESVSCYEYENGRDICVCDDDDFQGTLDWLNNEKGNPKMKIYPNEIEICF